jgi:hypothetical protein
MAGADKRLGFITEVPKPAIREFLRKVLRLSIYVKD